MSKQKLLEEQLEGVELVEDSKKVHLEEKLYWKWKFSLERRKSSILNEKRVNLQRDLMAREIENKKLKLTLYKENLQQANTARDETDLQYQAVLDELENALGFEFKDCLVDETTLEVKKISELEKNMNE